MRVSTSQIYDAGALNIQRSQSETLKTYNQISSGRRILTPADDPVAAAQALVVTQSQAVTAQQVTNQGNATSQLGTVDNQLTSLTNLLQSVRSNVIRAGNTTLTSSDRQAIATDLEASLSQILGIANSDNGSGDFLFSGYQGGTRPFAIDASKSAVPPATTSPVAYYGDDGERLLQVSSSRQMEVSVPGSDVFMNIRTGNGTFATATGGNLAKPPVLPVLPAKAANNLGSATVDAGSVLDPGKWSAAGNPKDLMVQFTVTTDASGLKSTTYKIYNTSVVPPAALSATPLNYTSGQAIALQDTTDTTNVPPIVIDYGASIVVQGQPEDGDTLTVAPSTNQSLFQTMQSLIGTLRTPVATTTYTSTQYANELAEQLANLDQSMNSIGQVQATVGARMRELDSLGTASSDLALQYSTTLSDLQELDYNKALSDYAKQQVSLEAAQKAFVQISGLSLFNYL